MAQIDVILPFHNRAWSLPRAVESVLAQSFSDFTLFLIDDGSDDSSIDVLVPYLKDTRVRLYTLKENSGVSKARNYGVSLGSAPLLCFIDSDDAWEKQKLELQFEHFQNHEFRITQTKEVWIRNGTRVNPPKRLKKREGDFFEASLKDCMITPSSVMLERSLFEEHNGFDESLPACEDYDLWLRVTQTHPVGLLDEFLMTRWGGHEDQLSAKYPAMDRYRIKSLLKLLQDDLPAEKRTAAVQVLRKKVVILQKGALKHKNNAVLLECENAFNYLDTL